MSQNDDMFTTNITFEWNPPPGNGVQTVVDKYVFAIYPQLLSSTTSNFVYSTNLTVTQEYNVDYTATLIAVNCAGESDPVTLSNVKFSKLI